MVWKRDQYALLSVFADKGPTNRRLLADLYMWRTHFTSYADVSEADVDMKHGLFNDLSENCR